jgi:hypothetical protein
MGMKSFWRLLVLFGVFLLILAIFQPNARLDRIALAFGAALLINFFASRWEQQAIDKKAARLSQLGLPPRKDTPAWPWYIAMVTAALLAYSSFEGSYLAAFIGALVVIGAQTIVDRTISQRAKREQEELERKRSWEQFQNRYSSGYLPIPWHQLEQMYDNGAPIAEIEATLHHAVADPSGLTLGHQRFSKGGLPIKISEERRVRHIYVIGRTGKGKTHFLRTLIYQDLEAGQGFAVLASDQSFITEKILPFIPVTRLDDVIYFNPADSDYPVSFNPLTLDPGEDINLRVDENLAIFQRLLDIPGHQTEDILRHSFYALLERGHTTLLDVARLLDPTDARLREKIVRSSKQSHVVEFFSERYAMFPKSAHRPITTRLSPIIASAPARRLLCNPHRSLNFRQIMDEGRVALFNVSESVLGEQTSHLLGHLIVSKFQIAALGRGSVPEAGRRFFALYVDEFHTFVTSSATSFETLLSRARQYRVGLVIAHQSSSQLPTPLFKAAVGADTKICFSVSHEDARRMANEFAGEVEPATLNRLATGQAYCQIGANVLPFGVPPLDHVQPDSARAQEAVDRSRRKWGAPHRGAPASELAAGDEQRDEQNQPLGPEHRAIGDETPAESPLPGRGGAQHKSLQSLVKRIGEKRGFQVTIEKRVLGGHGHIDVALERPGCSIACEISVTTRAQHEVQNLTKCI